MVAMHVLEVAEHQDAQLGMCTRTVKGTARRIVKSSA
jgi:hypothetical protein